MSRKQNINPEDLIVQLTEERLTSNPFSKREINVLRKIAKQSVIGHFSQRAFFEKVRQLKADGKSIAGIADERSYTAIRKMFIEIWREENAKYAHPDD